MDRRLKILLLVLVYFIVCAKSCVDDKSRTGWELNRAEMARDSILLGFEAAYLSEDSRFAAEVTAIHKLEDMADYIEIYTDISMDSVFREKAGDMTRDMFISEEVRLSFGLMKHKKMKSVSLDEFLKTGFGDDMVKAEVSFDSIRVEQPLQKTDESTYSGKLAAFQTIRLYPSADSSLSASKPVTINFISSKQAKIIGTDTLMVWEVSLGGLE
jgi:hypothetical protein